MTSAHTQISSSEAVLQRVISMYTRTDILVQHLDLILNRMLQDAVDIKVKVAQGSFEAVDIPASLEDDSLTQLMTVKARLEEIRDYHKGQMDQLKAAIEEARAAAPSLAVAVEGLDRPLVVTESQEVIQKRREEEVSALRAHLVERMLNRVPPEAPAKVEEASVEQSASLPSVEVPEAPVAAPAPLAAPSRLPSPIEALNEEFTPENSLKRLFSDSSPLLDIFAGGPWLPQGKGRITVGSSGFKWYKKIDPMDRGGIDRAKLPSGFYSGDTQPRYVLLRMKNSIIVWTFSLEPEAASVYMVGLSDADGAHRWFQPNELSATYTRRLVLEVLEAQKSIQAAL